MHTLVSVSVGDRWLTVKNWLIHKKRKVELAPKRTWKRYWVCLKGTVLLFYVCDENESVNEESVPRHMLGEWHDMKLMYNLKNMHHKLLY